MHRVVVVALALVACGKSKTSKDIAEAHRATAEPALAQVARLAPIVAKQPPLTEAKVELPSGVTLDFTGFKNPATNAGVAYLTELANPCSPILWDVDPERPGEDRNMTPNEPISRPLWLRVPQCLLAGKTTYETEALDLTEDAFVMLEKQIKYVLVIRLAKAQRPRLESKSQTFESGLFEGDALLFELATAKLLGGFPFAYHNSEKVKVARGAGQTDTLAYDLIDVAKWDLAKKLQALAPGTNIRP